MVWLAGRLTDKWSQMDQQTDRWIVWLVTFVCSWRIVVLQPCQCNSREATDCLLVLMLWELLMHQSRTIYPLTKSYSPSTLYLYVSLLLLLCSAYMLCGTKVQWPGGRATASITGSKGWLSTWWWKDSQNWGSNQVI